MENKHHVKIYLEFPYVKFCKRIQIFIEFKFNCQNEMLVMLKMGWASMLIPNYNFCLKPVLWIVYTYWKLTHHSFKMAEFYFCILRMVRSCISKCFFTKIFEITIFSNFWLKVEQFIKKWFPPLPRRGPEPATRYQQPTTY